MFVRTQGRLRSRTGLEQFALDERWGFVLCEDQQAAMARLARGFPRVLGGRTDTLGPASATSSEHAAAIRASLGYAIVRLPGGSAFTKELLDARPHNRLRHQILRGPSGRTDAAAALVPGVGEADERAGLLGLPDEHASKTRDTRRAQSRGATAGERSSESGAEGAAEGVTAPSHPPLTLVQFNAQLRSKEPAEERGSHARVRDVRNRGEAVRRAGAVVVFRVLGASCMR
jgi:hypothetical protein